MRTIDVLKKWCHITDGPTLEKEVLRFETAILEAAEELGRQTGESGIQVLPGVAKLLHDLGADKDQRGGEEKWAICTSCKCGVVHSTSAKYADSSATHFYAGRAIPIAGLPVPKVFVTADSVTRGKPFPDPYLLGASGCNASPFECEHPAPTIRFL